MNNKQQPKKFDRKRFRQNIPLIVMFIPVILFYLIFKYAPMGGLIIAFKDYNLMDGVFRSPWAGWGNFSKLFSNPNSIKIIRNTLLLSSLNIFIGFPFPIILAILLNEVRKMWFKKTVQTLVYLPYFYSWIIVGGIIFSIFGMEGSWLNHWITEWWGEPYPFLYNIQSWITIFVSSSIWKDMGFNAIIFMAAMSTIDPSLYESAGMDGANKWKQIIHITLPGISSTIMLIFILSMGRILEVGFDQIYILQNAAVNDVADVISTYIYRVGLQGAQFSLTTAMGMFESVVAFILLLTVNGVARRFDRGLF
ncbi:protein LplB [Paenibacillus baekrokdamisoli]|uniref:Protein LplB n=1 Tax=Paenibacillus baekrokdamisoli TaxID=1712516 RepID=A0A3G9JAI2_9BACL|nr:ABC transporter permease subunit [Paenibacillus baekrokdamisoli]MBB3071979.1 putative aldouronate transport system permease protein [Paenibacillus baekrokdamisoli]BBH20284.1 protein LplB [Paenibacillus baekrokdamisoli]